MANPQLPTLSFVAHPYLETIPFFLLQESALIFDDFLVCFQGQYPASHLSPESRCYVILSDKEFLYRLESRCPKPGSSDEPRHRVPRISGRHTRPLIAHSVIPSRMYDHP